MMLFTVEAQTKNLKISAPFLELKLESERRF